MTQTSHVFVFNKPFNYKRKLFLLGRESNHWWCYYWQILNMVYKTSRLCSRNYANIQLFRDRLSEKCCRRQSQKVLWGMLNTLLLLSFSTSRHMSKASTHQSFKFLWKTVVNSNHPQYRSGLSRALYPTTFLKLAVC